MAITKTIEIGSIEIVTEYKHIQDKELSRSFHRHVVTPDISAEDLAKEHAEVQTIANSGIWTQAIKDAWAAHLAEKQG